MGFQRKKCAILVVAAFIGAVSLLAACGGSSSDTAETSEAAPTAVTGSDEGQPAAAPQGSIDDEPGDLQVGSWPENDDERLWPGYTDNYPRPTFEFTGPADEALAKVQAGLELDVVDICAQDVPRWIELDLIQPWDTSLISNFPDLIPSLVEPGIVDGKQYLIPIGYETWGLVINTDVVDVPESEYSWAMLWDPQYSGKIGWFDRPLTLTHAALGLGLADPWNMSPEERQTVRDHLIESKELLRTFYDDDPTAGADFASGNVVISNGTSATWLAALAAGAENVEYVTPKEGRTVSVCGLALLKNTENFYHAHKLIDAWMSEEAAQYQMEVVGFNHSNGNADLSNLSPDFVEAYGLGDPAALEPPRANVTPYQPERQEFVRTWNEVVQG